MELVEGETLEKLIERSGRLEAKLALEIATQVAAGLAAVRTSRSSFIGTSNQYHKLAKGNPKNPIPYCPLPPRIW